MRASGCLSESQGYPQLLIRAPTPLIRARFCGGKGPSVNFLPNSRRHMGRLWHGSASGFTPNPAGFGGTSPQAGTANDKRKRRITALLAYSNISIAAEDRPLAKGWAISENPVFGTWLMRIEAGLLLTYAKVTGGGLRFWW